MREREARLRVRLGLAIASKQEISSRYFIEGGAEEPEASLRCASRNDPEDFSSSKMSLRVYESYSIF